MNPMTQKMTTKQGCDTGMAFTLILLLVTYFSKNNAFALPAILLLVLTMTWPDIFKPLAVLWFGLSRLLGSVVSRVLLTLVFVVVAVPVGLVRKMAGADAMRLKEWKKEQTVFTERNHTYEAKDLETPY